MSGIPERPSRSEALASGEEGPPEEAEGPEVRDPQVLVVQSVGEPGLREHLVEGGPGGGGHSVPKRRGRPCPVDGKGPVRHAQSSGDALQESFRQLEGGAVREIEPGDHPVPMLLQVGAQGGLETLRR